MRNGREQGPWSALVMAAVALSTVGVALGQAPDEKAASPKARAGEKATRDKAGKDRPAKGGLRAAGGAPPKKFARNAVDPFAKPAPARDVAVAEPALPAIWPYHYRFKIVSFDGTPQAAAYYPAQRTYAPVLLLIHEKGRRGKDFEDPIEELKGKGLAESLQAQGYAVLILDLRGHGANPRKEVGPRDGYLMVRDLQAAYEFLVDRHNREEVNLAKFGVIAVGEGVDLAAAWAATPGGAVSSEGRISDLGALVCVSPAAEGFGFNLARTLPVIAPRVPMLLMTGERDNASLNPVKDAQAIVTRPPQRQSKIQYYATPLHGYKLLQFQPKVPEDIVAFFDATIKKLRLEEWEPRYILTPVTYGEIELVQGKKPGAAAPAPAPAKAEEKKAEEKKAEEKGKAEPEKKAEEKKADEKKADEPVRKQSKPSSDSKTSGPAAGDEGAGAPKKKPSR